MPISSAHQFRKFSSFLLAYFAFFTLPTFFCCQHFSSFDSRDRFRTVASCKSFGHLITSSYFPGVPLILQNTALGSTCCLLFVCLFVRHHAKNGLINRKMVVDCPQ